MTIKLKGGPESPETKSRPLHKKNPDVGTKTTVFASTILVEQEDAKTFAENEEVRHYTGFTWLTFLMGLLDHPDGLG